MNRAHHRIARRRMALLGGSTSPGDVLAAAAYLLSPWRLVDGPAIREYERAFADSVGARYAYSYSAGRVALYGILRALGVGVGDEVLIQVPTHIVVANAIRYTGARAVFVDSCPDTFNIDLAAAKRKITEKTRAIVLQHTFGIPADLEASLDLGREHGLEVIEDCVHALGARYEGRPVGTFGRASFFSTEETKTITTTMGGMAVTDDGEVARALAEFQLTCSRPPPSLVVRYLLKLVSYELLTEPHLHPFTRGLYEAMGRRNPLPGPTTKEEVHGLRPTRYARRLSNAQAALGLRQLRRLQANLDHRSWVAGEYAERLERLGFPIPAMPSSAEPSFVRYPLLVRDRQAAVAAVSPHAVLGTWFTSVLEEALDPTSCEYEQGSCPIAEMLAERLVNLPTHERVKLQDIEAIIAGLAQAERGVSSAEVPGRRV
jgi:perosamine synthetase